MKRAWPFFWRYLLVVAISCVLAFVISQNKAAAQAAAVVKAVDYSAAGPLPVKSVTQSWTDARRTRELPVRIYQPEPTASSAAGGDKDAAAARFPVILFSHGLGGNRDGGARWARHWASHGYVVVAIQHPGSDDSLWKGRAPGEVEQGLKRGMTLTNLGLRVGDVQFAIDEVVRRSAAGETEFVRADAKKLGMSGHSFGAQTTLSVAGQKAPTLGGQSGLDLRIVAAVAFSPNARNKNRLPHQFGDIRIPLMSITGTEDGSILGDGTRYQDRIMPWEHMPAGGKYLLVFDAGDHMVFGGHELGGRRPETARDREIQADVNAATLAFWNATLKGDQTARKWLDSGEINVLLESRDRFAAK